MNMFERAIRNKIKTENRKIDKANARLRIEKDEKEIKKIKLQIMRLDGKCEAYIEVLKMIKEEVKE